MTPVRYFMLKVKTKRNSKRKANAQAYFARVFLRRKSLRLALIW